ncbi:hypothetical protein LCGC14_0710610 [marine sediment metagenome]|uniref:Uncharacterized protein n=2 Tax=root TaxID=1 RepID=A0A831VPG1_9FLAO|nr:hypothetical protein [Pricia antarctica]
MNRYSTAMTACLMLSLSACNPTANLLSAPPGQEVVLPKFVDRVREGNLSVITEFVLTNPPGEVLDITTSNVSAGGHPVIHLLDQNTGQQLTVGETRTEGEPAHLTYSGSSTKFILVVRSRIQNAGGSVDLLKNGQPWKQDVEFGGWHLAYAELPRFEHLQMVHLPNGAIGTQLLYVLATNNRDIAFRTKGGRRSGAPDFAIPSNLGRRNVIAGSPRSENIGRVRIVRNDAGVLPQVDADNDGLGAELEAALGTCDALTGSTTGIDGITFDCSIATDAKDTDGDGLRDDWEVLGLERRYLHSASSFAIEDLPLPAWGADPRHKDLFIEIDFMEKRPNETAQRLEPSKARQFAAYFEDQINEPTALRDALRAVVLRNPDRTRGINVHLDTGRSPETTADARLYGDWGGYTSVPPVIDGNGDTVGADFKTAWTDNMSPARRGIFRYILAYSSGGGQVPINSFAASGPMNSAWVLAHEFGHGMGLGHSGPAGATGVVDTNCKPNYQSLMNYAFQSNPTGFSDGLGAPPLNNMALTEWNAVSPSNTEYLDVLESVFKYWVNRQTGDVDWNRDGEIAPSGTTVRAYANFKPGGGGCEYTRYNQSLIPRSGSFQSPALARLGNRLYSFYSSLGDVFYTSSTDAGNCPVPDITPCATWAETKSVGGVPAKNGFDIVRTGTGNNAQLLIVTIDSNGRLWQKRLSINSQNQEVWGERSIIPRSGLAAGEPSLSDLGGCKIFLSYRGADNVVRFNRLSCSDNFTNWSGEQTAVDQNNAEIKMADFASPGLGRAYLSEPGLAQLYGAFANTAGTLNLYRFNESSNLWENTNLLDRRPGPIQGRPALAWTSENTAPDFPGRFHLMFIDRDITIAHSVREKERTVRMMTSYVNVRENIDGTLTKDIRVGLYAPFDNVWNYAFGIDLFFEPGVDSNLRALQTLAINKSGRWAKVQFRPKADGINDFTMTNYNDWKVMNSSLCKNVVNPGGLLTAPAVNCPDD